MRKVWIICGVLLAGSVLVWLGAAGRWHKRSSATAPAAHARLARSHSTVWAGIRRIDGPQANAMAEPGTAGEGESATSTNPQDQGDEMMQASLEDEETARKLLQHFPDLSEEEQVEAAGQLSVALSDEDYPALGAYLTDAATPEPVLDALLDGLLLRDDAIQAPLLLEVARLQDHPKAQEARALLADLIGQQLDEDPARMTAMVQRWLEANASARKARRQ